MKRLLPSFSFPAFGFWAVCQAVRKRKHPFCTRLGGRQLLPPFLKLLQGKPNPILDTDREAERMTEGYAEAPPRALVIDDDDMAAMLILEALKREGYEVAKSKDGQEAFHLILQEKFDLVTTDLEMPKMNGINFLKRLRSSPYKATKVVVVSGQLSPERVGDLKNLQIAKIFTKPLDLGAFVRAVNEFIGYQGNWKNVRASELSDDEFEVG